MKEEPHKENFQDMRLIRGFYETLEIDYHEFKLNNYNIRETIEYRGDLLMWTQMTEQFIDKQIYDDLTTAYENMLYRIFKYSNTISELAAEDPVFYDLLNNEKYSFLSPYYIAKVYLREEVSDINNIEKRTKKILKKTLEEIKSISRTFKRQFKKLFEEFIYRHPIEYTIVEYSNSIFATSHFANFMQNAIELIHKFMRELIDHHVILLNSAVDTITSEIFPFIQIINADDENTLLII